MAGDGFKVAISVCLEGKYCRRFFELASTVLRSPSFFIFLIIVCALLIRMYFLIGFAGGDPQDDGIYLNITKEILKKGFYDHNLQRRLVIQEEIINPIYIFPSRLVFNYVNALSFFLFGVNDFTAVLFSLLCSLLGIYFVYRIGSLLFNHRVGLLSGVFLAIMPLDSIYATRITPDVPVAFFITLALYLFLKGLKEERGLWMWAAGVVTGLGYLVKETAMVAVMVMGIWVVISWIREKKFPKKSFYVVVGLLLVVVLEGLYYQMVTGYFFLRPQLISKVYKSKYGSEWLPFVAQCDLKWVLIEYPLNTVLMQLKTLLNFYHHMPELSYFGLFFYPVLLSLLYLPFRKIAGRGVIITWFLVVYFFVEFGPLEVSFGPDSLIKYGLIEKQPRYLTILIAPSVILLSLFLYHVRLPYKKTIAVAVMLVVFLSSYECVSSTYHYFSGHTRDVREATRYLQKLPPKKVYSDWLGLDQIFYYSGFHFNDLRNIEMLARNPSHDAQGDAYVVVGGSRGAGVIAIAFEKNYRTLLEKIPEEWIALKTISGQNDVFRSRDLTIYYIPQ